MTILMSSIARSFALAASLAAFALPVASALAAPQSATACGEWKTDFGQPGANNPIFASTTYNGQLHVAGQFTVAGGTNVSRIARWDGFTWAPLGTGVNGTVEAMIEFNGELIVAGQFSQAGGASASRIARWNGASWSTMGSGFDNTVLSLTVHEGQLIACGNFANSGSTVLNRIARWNGGASGGQWEPIGPGFNATVRSVASFGGELYAIGTFTSTGDLLRKGIARWDGTTWNAVGTGIAGTPEAALVYDGRLIVAGTVTNAGGASMSNITAWDGQNWAPVGSGLNGAVHSLLVSEEDGASILLAGGAFTGTGVTPTLLLNRVARFDGIEWQPMGGAAMNDTVHTLAHFNGRLVAAGSFLTAGTEFVNRIAVLEPCQTTAACPADLDHNGEVSASDMAILLGAWGACD